jgi:hypothetical protein
MDKLITNVYKFHTPLSTLWIYSFVQNLDLLDVSLVVSNGYLNKSRIIKDTFERS